MLFVNKSSIGCFKLSRPTVLALFVTVFLGIASEAKAITFTFDDAYVIGLTPGEPSSPAAEADYINHLIDMVPGTTGSGPSSPPNYTRSSNTLCYPDCPEATDTGAFTENTGGDNDGNLDSGFTYLLAKYDGPNGGDVIWYVAGLSGDFTVPNELGSNNPLCTVGGGGGCGISHWALFNATTTVTTTPTTTTPTTTTPTTTTPQVPEPASLFLVGTGLIGMTAFVRRRRQ